MRATFRHQRLGQPFLGALLCAALLALKIPAATDNEEISPRPPDTTSEIHTQHWSLRPLAKAKLSSTGNQTWCATPIDTFILATLEKNGLQPSPPADQGTLLRRVYFDLIGLPPTPSEQEAFLQDKSPRAFETVVDRLLASPRYGERWARHWMDAAHFAETHGHDQDRIRTNAWPYRDYLIRSFNEDKPYARFVQEQLAGDVLFPDDPQATVALGFIAAGPWDESSLRDIREETTDRQIARYLDRDDMVTAAMSTFTSSTVHCARCHDHKFDPISQQDYYSLQAVFAGVDRAERFYDPNPKTHVTRQALLKQKSALEKKDKTVLATLLEPSLQAEVVIWEKSLVSHAVAWTVLDPISFVSSNGATLTKQADLSLLASGARPDKDTYAIVARTPVRGLTALRLEVLADDSLPHKGPGRQDNGNLHLSEFRLFASPATEFPLPPAKVSATTNAAASPNALPVKAGTSNATLVALQHPTADFDQDGWTIRHALDGVEKTAWGIYPQVGKSHQAVFELKENIDFAAVLTFILEQQHGGGHLIGRPRLSLTTAPRPVRLNSLPEGIARILATPAPQRTEEQKLELTAHYLKGQIETKLAALPKPQMVYAAASDFTPDGGLVPIKAPRPIAILKRGDINRPGEAAQPGALTCVSSLPARFEISDWNNEGLRRAAFARWITDAHNPLTWRSLVNRIWHYHFGRGLVDTPNDFGRMGGRPSHPELLDWLASWFLEHDGSLKQLHRLIVTSAVYRQASQGEPSPRRPEGQEAIRENDQRAVAIDSDNRLLWRMNRTRLDAESIRDAVLQITGQLDLTMGGPSMKQFALSPGVHVTPVVDYAGFDVDSPPSRRRSVYRFVFRTLPDPFMDSLDCADASQLTPSRNTSVTALQALSMLNDHFIVRQSEHFAERVDGMGRDLNSRITAACQLALGRGPTQDELPDLAAYAQRHGLANLCRLLLNSNEFMFVN